MPVRDTAQFLIAHPFEPFVDVVQIRNQLGEVIPAAVADPHCGVTWSPLGIRRNLLLGGVASACALQLEPIAICGVLRSRGFH
jgi:hypothetical protein